MGEVVVVTCVLESSLSLAAEWPHVLSDYIVPLLHRLGDAHSNQFRISFVGYGTADSRPTPILNRLFFIQPSSMLQKMREYPQDLGIGLVGTGGGYGMAALEGIVAALEMFDTLKTSVDKAEVTCMLLHIASNPPDPAERPLWNVSPSLDSVTWDTLPAEIRKRGIHYNTILLKQIPRLSDLHTSTAVGASQTPWFTVKAPHVVRLSGFPQPQKGTKRAGANTPASDHSPELTKRLKTQPVSPQKSPAVAPAVPPPSSSPATATTAAPPTSEMSITTAMLLDPAKRSEIAERLRQAELALRQQQAALQQLEKEGRLEDARKLRAIWTQRAEKLKQFKTQLIQQAQQVAAEQGTRPPTAGPSNQGPTAAKPPEVPSSHPPALKQEPVRATPQPVAPAPPATQHSPTKPPAPVQIPPQVTPELANQMQKLLEQNKRNPSTQSQLGASASNVPEKLPPLRPGSWLGTFSWRGFDSETHIRKDVHTRVMANCKDEHVAAMRSETWPATMSLAPSQHPAVPYADLLNWLRNTPFIPIGIRPAPASSDMPAQEAKTNEEHYRGLIRLLTEKNVYALAAWPGVNGVPENRLLIFSPNSQGLGGAYFPMPGGMPELPRANGDHPMPALGSVPDSLQASASSAGSGLGPGPTTSSVPAQLPAALLALLQQQMSPEQLAAFHRLPQDRRTVIIKAFMARMAAARQQQQQQQQTPQQQQIANLNPQIAQQLRQQQQQQQQSQQMNAWAQGGPNMAAILSQLAGKGQHQAGPSNLGQQPQQPGTMHGANPMTNLPLGINMAAMANLPNVGSMGNMGMNFGMQAAPPQSQGQPGMIPGMHRRTPSGNTNLSFGVMQSFMQRNKDGTSGGPNGSLGGMG